MDVYDQALDYDSFLAALPSLMEKYAEKVVVFHACEQVGIFNDMLEAVQFGTDKFGPRRFIAQEVKVEEPKILSYSLLL